LSGYFDHVRCHSCNAHIDPERIDKEEGKMVCPACGEDLKLTDLFGVKASFLENEGPQVGLDDLVPGSGGHFENPWGQPDLGDYAKKNASYDYASEEERQQFRDGMVGQQAVQGQKGYADDSSPRSKSRGVSDDELPPGAIRARHIDPPDRSEGRYAEPVPTPKPAPRRRYPPNNAKPEDHAMIRTGSGEDDDYAPKPIPDVPPPGSALDMLRKMKGKKGGNEVSAADDDPERPVKKKRRRY